MSRGFVVRASRVGADFVGVCRSRQKLPTQTTLPQTRGNPSEGGIAS